MKSHALPLACLAAIAAAAAAQTTTTYRGVTVREPAPYGAAGLAYQDNFKALADRIGNHIEAADDPTADDDEVGTGGESAVMARSTWRNASDNGLWMCLESSAGAAVWVELTAIDVDWASPAVIGATTPNAAAFSAVGVGEQASSYGLAITQDGSTDGIRVTSSAGTGNCRLYAFSVNAYLSASGTLYIGSTDPTRPMYLATESQSGNVYLFSATVGSPSCYIYGWDAGDSSKKYGRHYIDSAGDYNVLAQDDMCLGAGAAGRMRIESDGTIHVVADNQILAFGAGRELDSYMRWSGTGFDLYSAGGSLVASAGGGSATIQSTSSFTRVRSTSSYVICQSGAAQSQYYDCGGDFLWRDVDNGSVTRMSLASGTGELDVDGPIEFAPASTDTPTNNGDVVIEATANDTLTFKLRGSDGTVRSATLTLAP